MNTEGYRQVLLDGCDITLGNRTMELSIVPLRRHYHQANINEFQVCCCHPKVSTKDKSTGLLNPYIKHYKNVDHAVDDFLRLKVSLYSW